MIKTTLEFSNISFNNPVQNDFVSLIDESSLSKIEAAKKDLSAPKIIQGPVTPEQTVYRVSIPSVQQMLSGILHQSICLILSLLITGNFQ